MMRVRRWLLRLGVAGLVVSLVGIGVAVVGYQEQVVRSPGAHIDEAFIQAVIARESPVLYRDGRTPIGVFFAQEHRQYVTYEELPRAWVQGIIAAEDKRYFSHKGIDPEGIARAMRQNILAGRVVAGGSTLTQQTAKNLYYRPDRSFRSKWEELLNALRLEHRYSKEKILEFYANQFHVSANGRGLGIAARYFFDTEASALDTLQSAFLAGMVKGPANYDPFIARSPERREAALSRAHDRTRYVLDRMAVAGEVDERGRAVPALSAAEHAEWVAELDARFAEDRFFNRGQFRYDSHVLLDEVEARLAEAPFPALFAELGIDNPSTAGIQVVTTVDVVAQREATYGLWHHLSDVGPVMEGIEASDFRLHDPPALDRHDPPQEHEFRAARVLSAAADALVLDMGGVECAVDAEALRRAGTTLARARKGEGWRKASDKDIAEIVAALPAGSAVWASLAEEGRCELELRPELQGAVMVLDRGRIRAMVGGNDNRNFNRAVTAKRQLGSTWKPLIYDAALQLNWTPLDPLDNRAWGFPFERVWYYPRAAHKSLDQVSLAWAGTRSENLASVWLLYHLTDRLSASELDQVAAAAGMTRRPEESAADYLLRIRDDNGVISTRDHYPEMAWMAARLEVADGLEEQAPEQALELRSLVYGSGVADEAARVRRKYTGSNRSRRLAALENNFLSLEARGEGCAAGLSALVAVSERAAAALQQANEVQVPSGLLPRLFQRDQEEQPILEALEQPVDGLPVIDELGALVFQREGSALAVGCAAAVPEDWQRMSPALLDDIGRAVVSVEEVELSVEGRIALSTLRQTRNTARRWELLLADVDPYSMDALRYHPDFRLLVGIRYVSQLAQRLGVSSALPPVLAMPLGAAEISLEEAAAMYQGLLTGQAWTYPGQKTTPSALPGIRDMEPVPAQTRSTQLISQIRDRDGNVLYRSSVEPVPISDPVAGRLVGGILRAVIDWGTGRRAKGAVRLGGQSVPLMGKTGTTNSYRNAAFCGYVPAARDGQWSWEDGLTVAVYVGYDDNRKMSRGTTRLSGASGALPAWITTVQGLVKSGMLGDAPGTGPMPLPEGIAPVAVREGSGLPLEEGEADTGRTVLAWGWKSPWNDELSIKRRFAPIAAPAEVRIPPVSLPQIEEEDLDDVEDVWIEEMGSP